MATFEVLTTSNAIGGGSSYLVYRANLNQTGTNPPVPTILENTLGFTPTWIYDVSGAYYIQNAIFSPLTTGVIIQAVLDNGATTAAAGVQGDLVYVNTALNKTLGDDLLVDTYFEIKVNI